MLSATVHELAVHITTLQVGCQKKTDRVIPNKWFCESTAYIAITSGSASQPLPVYTMHMYITANQQASHPVCFLLTT